MLLKSVLFYIPPWYASKYEGNHPLRFYVASCDESVLFMYPNSVIIYDNLMVYPNVSFDDWESRGWQARRAIMIG